MPKKKKVKKVKKAKKVKLLNKIKSPLKSSDKKSTIPGSDEKPEIKKIKKQPTEKKIIKSFINSYILNDDVDLILNNAEELEKNSNQLLNFTSIIKKESDEIKSDIIRHLWKIIISDKSIDQYE